MSRILLGVADVSCLEEVENYKKAYDCVSVYRKEKADGYKSLKDKQRCVGAGILLNGMLQKWNCAEVPSDVKPDVNYINLTEIMTHYDKKLDYNITVTANGKPIFADHREMHFNISHTGPYVVCAIADCPLGVDIDGGRDVRDRVAERFFSEAECQWIKADMSKAKERFFVLWTAKEAYAKLTGEGIALAIGKACFDVKDDFELSLKGADSFEKNVTFYQYIFREEYCIALAKYQIVG